jgi:predicted  nucleic acid-binding Zn-ribbon protein
VQLTLRKQIEELNIVITEKNEKIKSLDQRLDNTAAASDDMDQLTKEITKLRSTLNDAESIVVDKDRDLKAIQIRLKDMGKESRATNEKLAKMVSIY